MLQAVVADVVDFAHKEAVVFRLHHGIVTDTDIVTELRYIALRGSIDRQLAVLEHLDVIGITPVSLQIALTLSLKGL